MSDISTIRAITHKVTGLLITFRRSVTDLTADATKGHGGGYTNGPKCQAFQLKKAGFLSSLRDFGSASKVLESA